MAHILLIDDDNLLRGLLRINLEEAGYTVTEARDGKEGLALQAQSPADLVLTDLIMPEKEGVETIIELRKKHPKVKIIAMSGGGRGSATDYLQTARKLGAARTLCKPFTDEELLAAIQEVLGAPA